MPLTDPRMMRARRFVVQEGETNSFDQRWLEYELWEAHGVRVLRLSLAQASSECVDSTPHSPLALANVECACSASPLP